jgi:hypothetical protein
LPHGYRAGRVWHFIHLKLKDGVDEDEPLRGDRATTIANDTVYKGECSFYSVYLVVTYVLD